MRPASRLTLALLLAASLFGLAGCGGGEEPAEPLPTVHDLETTNRELDVGIGGPGTLVLQAPGGGEFTYSRYGRLDIDRQGRLIHADGGLVLGVGSSPDVMPVPLAKLPMSMPPRATTRVQIQANLDAEESLADRDFRPDDPGTYSFSTSTQIVTDDGGLRWLTLQFRKVDRNRWDVHAGIADESASTVSHAANAAELHFDDGGWLVDRSPVTLWIAAGEAGLPRGLEIVFVDMTQFNARYALSRFSSDGYGRGRLLSVAPQYDGRLRLAYSNGQFSNGGQLMLARFTVFDRLQRSGQSSWRCRQGCSEPAFGVPASALLGGMHSGALNVAY